MTQTIALKIPDELAKRIEPMSEWLPSIIELSLIRFKTLATITASEVIDFLLQNPSPLQVLNYHVSDEAQGRLQRLLTLNSAGQLSEDELAELDELQRLEHVIVMLKARIMQEQN